MNLWFCKESDSYYKLLFLIMKNGKIMNFIIKNLTKLNPVKNQFS